jgi:hypothetical protein
VHYTLLGRVKTLYTDFSQTPRKRASVGEENSKMLKLILSSTPILTHVKFLPGTQRIRIKCNAILNYPE